MRQTIVRSSIGKVFVTVVEAADLMASDPNGKSDPFCVVKLGESQEQATPVVNNCLNPRWNHTVGTHTLAAHCTHALYAAVDGFRSN